MKIVILKFKVRRNRHLSPNIEGNYIIVDPNGLLHADGFDTFTEANSVCREINHSYTEAVMVAP